MEITFIETAWNKSKLLLKALIISALVLLLLIPTYSVQNLIEEREQRQKEAVAEVSNKWAGSQNIAGPVLVPSSIEAMGDSLNRPSLNDALLIGSIGLFLSLATIMYFSRKIQW